MLNGVKNGALIVLPGQVVLHQGPVLRRVEVPWVDLAILNVM